MVRANVDGVANAMRIARHRARIFRGWAGFTIRAGKYGNAIVPFRVVVGKPPLRKVSLPET
jgi:hypothetical protein